LSIYFLDSSALAKRYIAEIGSGWMQKISRRSARHTLVISELATIEFVALLSRRHRDKSISTKDFKLIEGLFFTHVRTQYQVIKTDTRAYQTARTLPPKHPLRTLDAIQLASAIVAQNIIGKSIIFVSADNRLLNIAQAEGFSIDNPNNYP
jgi:uncharacterized protein